MCQAGPQPSISQSAEKEPRQDSSMGFGSGHGHRSESTHCTSSFGVSAYNIYKYIILYVNDLLVNMNTSGHNQETTKHVT